MELVCFSGTVKASAGETNPPAAVWFPPSGEKTAWLTSSSTVSWTLMKYLRVIAAQVGEVRRRAPSSAPPSTPDPSCVSFPSANLPFQKSRTTTTPTLLTLTALSVLLFCVFHHAHILEKHTCHSMLSRFALVSGVVAAMGAFAAGNCNVSTVLPDAFLADWTVSSFVLTVEPNSCDIHKHESRRANICCVTSERSESPTSDCCCSSNVVSLLAICSYSRFNIGSCLPARWSAHASPPGSWHQLHVYLLLHRHAHGADQAVHAVWIRDDSPPVTHHLHSTPNRHHHLLYPLRGGFSSVRFLQSVSGKHTHTVGMRFTKRCFGPSPRNVRCYFVCADRLLLQAPVSCVWVDAQYQPAAVWAQLHRGVLLLLLLHVGEHLWQAGGRKAADAHHVLRGCRPGLQTPKYKRRGALKTRFEHFSRKDFYRCLNYFDVSWPVTMFVISWWGARYKNC